MDIKTMDTKAFIDEYFSTLDEDTARKNKSTIDRPELYSFEKKIGKKLLEMNEDELLEMISTFQTYNQKVDGYRKIAFSSYPSLARWFKKLWEYYSDNYKFIRNPWYSAKLKGGYAREYLSQYIDVFSHDDYDNLINVINTQNSSDMSDYLECLVRLLYDGVENAKEIVNITEKEINFKTKSIYLPGHVIKLSDRTCTLLRRIHYIEEMQMGNAVLQMVSWHDSYIKFRCRKSNVDKIQEWSLSQMTVKVSQLLTTFLSQQFGKQIVIKQINMLGLSERLIAEFGFDKAKEYVMSKKNVENNYQLMKFMQENGYRSDVSRFKYDMIPYFCPN